MPVIVLAAGGTGGHIFPALATAEALKKQECTAIFITDHRGKKYLPATEHIETLSVARFGGSMKERLKAPWLLLRSFFQSIQILRQHQPIALVGFGGYPSFPAALAAKILRIPLILHEQNAVLGRSNRLLSRFAARIAVAYPSPRFLPPHMLDKTVLVGNPVRDAFTRPFAYHLPHNTLPFQLLVLGGSQGASIFSTVVPDALASLPPALKHRLFVTQQARAEEVEQTRQRYKDFGITANVEAFFNNVPELLDTAHFVIARSGASTCAEIMAVGRPALFVPYQHAKDDHQTANAAHLLAAEAAWMEPQQTFSPQTLAILLERLLQNPSLLEKAAQAAHQLAPKNPAQKLASLAMSF